MKRVKTILAEREGVKARISVEVVAERGYLTQGETSRLIDALASDSMQTLARVQYLHVPLSDIKVK